MSSYEPRELVRNAVITLVRKAGGGTVTRPLLRDRPGSGATVTEPEPLAGIRAALDLEHAVRRLAADQARYAREDGRLWGEIGEVLYDATDLAPAAWAAGAFYYFAGDLGSGPSFAWTCPRCLKTVIDRGPEAGHPAEQERGHAEGCTRLAETVRAYDAQWGEGDG